MGLEDEANNLVLPSDERQFQASIRTHLFHRPAGDIIPLTKLELRILNRNLLVPLGRQLIFNCAAKG
jgi:hypothetical protein